MSACPLDRWTFSCHPGHPLDRSKDRQGIMNTDKGRTQRLVRWLKDKIENKRNRVGDHDPWWVTLMLDVGRPAVAIMILTMCAPGEHYLGVMAGWSTGLAWLTPAS